MPENTRSSERKQQNLKEWERYLTILEMRADERSMPYIAKKLGFKHASSIANILNRFDGLEALIASKVEESQRQAIESLPEHKPFKCEFGHVQVKRCKFGHPIYGHKSRWCCACDADIAFAAKWVKDEPEALQSNKGQAKESE